MIVNAFTIDVEDYFQVQNLATRVPRTNWERIPARVEANTERCLALLARAGVRATFFTLGWIAERNPALIRRIVAGGHEIASHGWEHIRADHQNPDEFRQDILRTKHLLEDLSGQKVIGYRAATFSIGAANLWAFDELAEAGYRYSSSIYPVRHDLYGMPGAPRVPYRPGSGALWEIPLTTVTIGGSVLPCSGGGYFRLLPYSLFRRGLTRVNKAEHRPGVFYTHPWELDPGQPRVAGLAPLARFRHYVNLGRTEARIERLLRDFAWDRMDRVFAETFASSAAPAPAREPAVG